MEMTTQDYDYDYGNYTYEPSMLNGLCRRDSDNNFGARLSILYYFMFLFSLFGNGLVLVIIHRFEKLTSVTNIFLLNLVLSSLIFMSSLPFNGVYMQLSNWIFGNVMCKMVGSIYYLGFYSSVLFLTLLTFDRHLAVVYSLSVCHVRKRSYAVISCAVVWLISSLACINPMIVYTTFTHNVEKITYCQEYPGDLPNINMQHLRTSGFYCQLFLFLILPLVVIIYCYVRITITVLSSRLVTKFKTVRLIFFIVLLFFLCWIPFNIVQLMNDETCEEAQRRGYVLHVSRNLAYFYFCVSPIFYTFVGKKFQNYFRKMLVNRFPGLKYHITVAQSSKTNPSSKSSPNDL